MYKFLAEKSRVEEVHAKIDEYVDASKATLDEVIDAADKVDVFGESGTLMVRHLDKVKNNKVKEKIIAACSESEREVVVSWENNKSLPKSLAKKTALVAFTTKQSNLATWIVEASSGRCSRAVARRIASTGPSAPYILAGLLSKEGDIELSDVKDDPRYEIFSMVDAVIAGKDVPEVFESIMQHSSAHQMMGMLKRRWQQYAIASGVSSKEFAEKMKMGSWQARRVHTEARKIGADRIVLGMEVLHKHDMQMARLVDDPTSIAERCVLELSSVS